MNGDPSDWVELAELRQGMYRFFAGALLTPDPQRLRAITEAAAHLGRRGVDGFAFAAPWRTMVACLDPPPDAAAFERDYLRLFMAGTDGCLCPPTESHHVAAGNEAPCVAEITRDYQSFWLAPRRGLPYPPDHVATELEAMATLCHREAHAWDEGEAARAVDILRLEWSFLDRHLFRWLPRFAARLRTIAAPGFYPAAVDATDAFVRHDHELVTTLSRLPTPQDAA